jgi:ribokinase
MIGQLGSDDIGTQLRQGLSKAGVDVTPIGTVKGASGVALITVAANGENSIVVAPGANTQLTPAYLDQQAAYIRKAGMVLAQLEIPLETVVHLAKLCADANVPLILDPAPARDLPPELLKQVAWFTPNETEAAHYIGETEKNLNKSAKQLQAKGIGGVILKLGAKGSFLATKSGTEARIQPFQVQAVDSTGAGDAFNGAFAAALTLGQSPLEAAIFASAASAISVTRKGAQASMATLAEVHQMLGDA